MRNILMDILLESDGVMNGFVLDSGRDIYTKKNDAWYSEKRPKVFDKNDPDYERLENVANMQIIKMNEKNPIPVGFKFKSRSGVEYTFNGKTFVSSDGIFLNSSQTQAILTTIINKQKQNVKGGVPPEPEQNANPEPSPESSTGSSDVKNGQSDSDSSNSDEQKNTNEPEVNDKLKGLADTIKTSNNANLIKTLLIRGDKISNLAADIILQGMSDVVIAKLKQQ